jgi:signal transduction histidine kinase
VGLLAAGVAHEIRNPLGRIQMAVGALREMTGKFPPGDKEAVDMLVDTATESVAAADAIVQGLLQSYRSEQLSMREVDINEVLLHSLDFLTPEIQEVGVSIHVDLADQTPSISIAEEEFQQAFAAIVRNAVQAMKEAGSVPADLFIRSSVGEMSGIGPDEGARSGNRLRDGDAVLIVTVEDTGPGMTKEQREAAFDPFFTTRPTGAGTGLGLTVARKLIDLHKGIIRMEDRGQGVPGLKVSIFLRFSGRNTTFV